LTWFFADMEAAVSNPNLFAKRPRSYVLLVDGSGILQDFPVMIQFASSILLEVLRPCSYRLWALMCRFEQLALIFIQAPQKRSPVAHCAAWIMRLVSYF